MICTCDRCQNTVDSLISVGVAVDIKNPHAYGSDFAHFSQKAQWCEACVRKTGLWPETEEIKADNPAPTLEDIVRDICRSEIAATSRP